MTDAITISKPRNRDGSTGHVLAKRSVTFTEIRSGQYSINADGFIPYIGKYNIPVCNDDPWLTINDPF